MDKNGRPKTKKPSQQLNDRLEKRDEREKQRLSKDIGSVAPGCLYTPDPPGSRKARRLERSSWSRRQIHSSDPSGQDAVVTPVWKPESTFRAISAPLGSRISGLGEDLSEVEWNPGTSEKPAPTERHQPGWTHWLGPFQWGEQEGIRASQNKCQITILRIPGAGFGGSHTNHSHPHGIGGVKHGLQPDVKIH